MLCGTNGAVAAMDRAYMSLRARKPQAKTTSEQSSPFRRWTTGSGAGSSYRHHDHRNMYNKQMSEGAAPAAAASGGVARWSLGLEQLLADPAGAAAFAHFLSKEFAAENIRFWWSCEQYSATEDAAKRAALANEIWQRHLAEGASEPVNVDAAARRAAALRLYQEPSPVDLFQQAQKQIFNVMKFDSYPRFLRSAEHAECARADLRGLPSPFLTATTAATTGGTDGAASPSAKLKKSASNASERRRSGGASLLPWKLRAPSRDRGHHPPADSPPPPPPPVTDVVKSSQLAAGQCSLCRVVLPDGATSVVGVQESLTVRRLVDRLLQRRNLVCTTYDVLLKEGNQVCGTPVELAAPSAVLGGREAVVERRAAVRLELGGRVLHVRARASRRLRHVLRPVLQRYQPRRAAARRVLRDGLHVHPDTLMQELDGARLQVVEVAEAADGECAADDRDDDGDSLSDLALRLHDDDAQSVSTCCSARAPSPPPPSSAGAACSGPASSGLVSSGPASSAGPASSGRVRAALRPGPPLHHHPPDFLENLRETQRQRLHSKDGPLPSPPSPSARPPPPLPPKPPQRTPTVV